jgi:hypothetical protein
MSTIIIGGGGGKAAVNNLVLLYPHMTAEQKGRAVELLERFIADVETLVEQVKVD